MNKPTRAAGEERNRPTRKSPAVSSAAVPSQPSVHPQCLWVSSRAFILNRNPEIVFLIFISMYLDLVGACIITSLRCRNRLTPTRVRHPRRSRDGCQPSSVCYFINNNITHNIMFGDFIQNNKAAANPYNIFVKYEKCYE